MAKALIICAAGMSSSLMAKKTTEFFKSKGDDIEVDAISATEGGKAIAAAEFDFTSSVRRPRCTISSLKKRLPRLASPSPKFPLRPIFLSLWVLKKWPT